jgi:hypothetical protein
MHRFCWLTVAGVTLLLVGCAGPGGPGASGADTAARFSGFCRCVDAADLLVYHQRIRAMSAEELGVEQAAATQALAKQKSDSARLRLAMLLSLPGSAFRDDGRAVALAEEVANRKNPDSSSLRPLASLIAANASEQRRQEDRNQKLAQRLQEEEKRAETLQQKLDGLKAIEKNLLNREPTKPVNVK